MPYTAPLKDIRFCLQHVAEANNLAEMPMFAEATAETVDAVLAEMGKLATETLAPLQRPGDEGSKLEDGTVKTPDGFKEGYAALAEGGWMGLAASPEHGGMGLPLTVQTAVNEMQASACLSLSLCPLMTQGSIEAFESHASPELVEKYLPKMISGEWNGTMNLTESQAGSDVGALKTKAEPEGDAYRITGQKIYISWGDHDMTDNIVHLVLARLPDAPSGSKGISLFVVPKFLEDGSANGVKTVSLEHKMGLNGSPTCVMAYEGAKGWLVGEENRGLACMFTMMNNARLGVGVEGLGVAEAAAQHALAFVADRVQGRAAMPADSPPTGAIIDHPDVRRMAMEMKARTEAVRAICYDTAKALDMARAAPEGEKEQWARRGAFLTPLAKAYGTQTGMKVAELGVQAHGGMGFIEETGAAQYYRDVRITAIYEGTNGIQAADLVGRKLSMDGGETARAILDDAETEISTGQSPMTRNLAAVHEAAEEVTQWMLAQNDMAERLAGSHAYLMVMSTLHASTLLHRGLRAAEANMADDPDFYQAKIAIAAYYLAHVAPEAMGYAMSAKLGSTLHYALTPEQMAS